MNYYERHIGDYLKDTAHLSLLEHGIYARLLDVYYTREAGLQADEAARLIGARTKEEKDALRSVLTEFFDFAGGLHTQDRCEREIARYQRKVAHNREVGKLGGRPPKLSVVQKPNGLSPGSENETQAEPEPNPPSLQTPDASKEKEPTVLVKRSASDAYRVPDCPYEEILAAFHAQLPTLPRIVVFNDARKRPLRSRWSEVCSAEKFDAQQGLAWFSDYFAMCSKSSFLTGREKDWKASFDWLVKPTNFAKTVEGNYQGAHA